MLDSVTKKRIDDLRNILVGKIPSPQSQVEQITTGLIYKFMHDMDNEAIEMGGVPSFFVDEYEKYSWKHLFNTKLGGVEKVNLYSDAIENLYNNPNAPSIFREIFKNSFLPFKDPSTLNMFLKEINEFHYSNSEQLGDAYEYLLSFMGSQGDAGQFRTPRHIIDFIIKIVNPQKNETILDPACGTSGFLISSYKHILSQNTKTRTGDKLNASERKQLGDNLVGYDIDPAMSRISLVNMYLHNFKSPNINEYDTLSSEDKWNEYFDVILANPPFFSPTGGIKPHSRFGVKSTRAEVLFVDYIMEHLKPKGRAGIIVPEGIIFQTNKAYKNLRKKLIEDFLVGVISLPAGVFQPYSAVKTSILILDRQLNQQSKNILFAKVKNDGYSLGTQRIPILENDLIEVERLIKDFYKEKKIENFDLIKCIKKSNIVEKDFILNISAYASEKDFISNFPTKLITDVATLQRGDTITKKDVIEGDIPVIAGGKKPAYFHNQPNRECGSITISSSGAYAGYVAFHEKPIFASDCFTAISKENSLDQKFLFYLLKSKQELIYKMQTGGGQPHVYAKNFNNFEIPCPPVEIQKNIVDELDNYQKIIDGCNQVIKNYKPNIEINPSWEMVELQYLIDKNLDSKRVPITKNVRKSGIIPYYGASGIVDHVEDYLFDENLLLISEDGANLKDRNYPIAFSVSGKCWVNNHAHVLRFKEYDIQKFIEFYFNQISLEPHLTGSAQPKLNQDALNKIKIPCPSKEEVKKIVNKINEELDAVNGNKKLIEIYTKKIQRKLNNIWGI